MSNEDEDAQLIEVADNELLRRMRAANEELKAIDRQIMFKTTRMLAQSADDVESTVNRLCDEADRVNLALADCLAGLGITTNAALFSALTLLMREALKNCCDRAEDISKRRVH